MKKKNKLTISDLESSFGNKKKAKQKNGRFNDSNAESGNSFFMKKLKQFFSRKNKDAVQNLVIVCGVVMLIALSCVAINRVDGKFDLAEQKLAAKSLLSEGAAQQTAAEKEATAEQSGDNETLNNDNDYFINYEMEKEKVRGEQLELLNEMADNENALPEVKEEAESKILAITEDMENEMLLESLLVAKYGGEAVVFVQEDKVNVILRPEGVEMNDNEADKIAQLVDTYTDIGYENAIIVIKD